MFDIIMPWARLTQLVEYRFCKPKVIGSTPIVGFFATLCEFIEKFTISFFRFSSSQKKKTKIYDEFVRFLFIQEMFFYEKTKISFSKISKKIFLFSEKFF